jgi:hypothetical protein
MNKWKQASFISLFRLPSLLVVASITGAVLISVGLWKAALGLLIGVFLYIINLFFLYESNKSLLGARSPQAGRFIAGISTIGRMIFLGVALAFVSRMWFPAFLAACSGLLAGQVNLQLSLLIQGRTSKKWSGL